MKKLLCTPLLFLLLFIFSGLAFGQAANVPVCNGSNGPNCTDYFGAGNYANSPLPAGSITGYTLIAGGSGYVNPVVVVTDPTGAGASATATATAGVITAVTGSGGTNYIMPQVTLVDVGVGGSLAAPTCGGLGQPVCGTGAMAAATLGGPFTGGMQKFLDPLVDLKTVLAVADTTTFPGTDYYEIHLVQFTQKLHSNLPPTTLRGYVQVPTGSVGCPATPAPKYLGPVILAQKNRAVRVKFTNCLAAGTGGNLFIPVDTTYMGVGAGPGGIYTENRATLHLHGGATPWISDGTPHQWTVPVGDPAPATLQLGDSVEYVPDMYFDSTGKVLPQCTSTTQPPPCSGGTPTQLAGATNNPGQGSLTFYWTNQQGGRLMFYHDHAYGITRLNVYAGEAAGYLLVDPVEEAGLAAATSPGTIPSLATADLPHLIPLVIQDKSFVPSAAQIGLQDPTWAANFGTTPGTANLGDLWFPHIYTPNQNPNDPTGANGFGRWDYGPWFFPPQTSLTAATPSTAVTTACTSSAFPGQTLAPTAACPTCGCPITPNPSGTPEGFMDTPVVNGVAYPVLHVAPAAYRFQILAAGNDRSWNLSWFVADATGKDVTMVPAVPPVAGSALPLCTAINPVTNPGLDMGLARVLLDATGNPMNGTGLPLNCWPNYGPSPGIPVQQTMWAADGRKGGAPDPRTAGPPWIQIGTEGGLLPAPVVIPATPVNYEANTRSITITNVAVHGLWLGPAERADVIVDFSAFNGKTLILYNDAPTPAPAIDSRLDYFTGDGDQSAIGGAPNTQPGYGPNTRTIMQVVVDQSLPNSVPFSLSALNAAFASTATAAGLFKSTQPTTIVPEAIYNSAYNATFANTYASIQANTLTFTPIAPLTFDNLPCATVPLAPVQCATLDQKAIQELFTLDYGRMNATLGTELPLTNFLVQTTLPFGYAEWPTEIIQSGQTQLWKITHNGVDTHFIHFHLFNVQVVNRMGWDGTIRPPDENEVGWKDTVRMNPLEDILVALQPITPTFPFPLPDSIRLLDVTMPAGTNPDPSMSGIDPATGNAIAGGLGTTNALVNLGWEYVWHCHILGHEENDMMRPIIFQVAPPAPTNLAAALGTPPNVVLTWADNSASEDSFTLQRSTTTAFLTTDPGFASFTLNSGNTTGFTTRGYGGTVTFTDTTGTAGTPYVYRVQANDSFTPQSPLSGIFQTVPLSSAWSNIASATVTLLTPAVTFTGAPASAAFNTTFTVTATTNASVMPTITPTGVCSVGAVTGTPASASATVTMISGTGTCSLTASWAATTTFNTATVTQTATAALAAPTVSFTGAPATAANGTTFTVTATTNASIAPTINGTGGVCTVGSISGTSPATATVSMISGAGTCTLTAAWAATANYATASVTQTTLAAQATPTVSFTGALASAVYSSQFSVTATTNANVMPSITPIGACSVGPVGGTSASATATVTMTSGTGTCTLTASWPATTLYAAASLAQSTAATKLASATTINSDLPNPSVVGQSVTVSFSVTGTGLAAPTGSVTVTASTGESCSGTLGAGNCSLIFKTAGSRTLSALYGGDPNYNTSTGAASQLVGDFAIGVKPGSQTVNGNQKANYTLTLTPISGLTGTVALSCSGYTGGPCTVTPSSVTLSGASQTATATVTTTKSTLGTFTITFSGNFNAGLLQHSTTGNLRVK
jgi:FtsP/CotA-like multicopper oxidase with cupredoxin domain